MNATIRAVLIAISNDGALFIAVAEQVGADKLTKLVKKAKKK